MDRPFGNWRKDLVSYLYGSSTIDNREGIMFRPETFQQPYVALRNIPYVYGDSSSGQESPSGGVLGAGQTVWTKEFKLKKSCSATAFVEGVGIVSLDPRWLVRGDALEQLGDGTTSKH